MLHPPHTPAISADYDPQHTVLALNMAIVSIQRIINTQDRTVLDMEYRNIISNLKLGSIESDNEIIELYQELMNVISGKLLSREATERLQKDYNEWEQRQITNAIFGLLLSAAKPVSLGLDLAVSAVSSYFAYQYVTDGPRRSISEELYKIDMQERESYNALQTRLLNSSWKLMRQYKLPDEYRLTQESVNYLFRAVNEPDNARSLNMLRALEEDFRIYPPYWVYRARSAQKAGEDSEAAKCFEEFGKIWRPVLRNDLWKVEAEKYYVQRAMKSGDNAEALRHVEEMRQNTPRSDWANNLFAGVAYFMLGQSEKGINCLELNINFGAEKEISSAVLAQMKAGKLDIATLPGDIRKVFGLSVLRLDVMKGLAESGDHEAQLTLGKMYADGEIVSRDFAEAVKWYGMAAEQNDEAAILTVAVLYSLGGPKLEKDYREAVKWCEKVAYEGSKAAQNMLAALYFEGGPNLEQDYYTSYVWCCVAEMTEEHFIDTTDTIAILSGVLGGVGAAISAPLLPLLAIGGAVGLLAGWIVGDNEYTIKEQIEGAGIFNLAKLSSAEMDKAKIDAGKIMSAIERRIQQRQQ